MTILCDRCKQEIADEAIPAASELDLGSLPSVSVLDYHELPKTSGVYFALSGSSVLYIGKAANIFARWSGHPHLGRLACAQGGRIAWLLVASAQLRDGLEKELIAIHKPSWNAGGAGFLRSFEVARQFPDITGGKLQRREYMEKLKERLFV